MPNHTETCSDLVSTRQRTKPLNAISPTAPFQATEPARTDVEMLQRLTELAMQLAELSARQALEEANAKPDQAAAQPSRPRRADPKLMFFRLAGFISATLTHKKRFAAGILPKAPRPAPEPAPRPTPEQASAAPEPPEDPRRPHIIRYLGEASGQSRKKRKTPLTPQHIETQVSAELAKDPHHRLQGRAILLKLCKSLDLPFYANRLHPDLFRPHAIGPPK